MARPLVLVVDDEESNRAFCRDALQLNGYDVVGACNTEEAVAILKTRDVDFVICDIAMPHNGRRMYEYLLEHFPHMAGRFIFVTGNPDSKAAVERMPKAAPCLMKPYSVRTLLDLLRAALGT